MHPCGHKHRSHAAAARCARSEAQGFPAYGKHKHIEIVAMSDEVTYRDVSWEEAERLVGHRLDRRRNYLVIGNWEGPGRDWLATHAKASGPCSGCSCDGEYPCNCCAEHGAGCDECGYTGRAVRRWPETLEPITGRACASKQRRRRGMGRKEGGSASRATWPLGRVYLTESLGERFAAQVARRPERYPKTACVREAIRQWVEAQEREAGK